MKKDIVLTLLILGFIFDNIIPFLPVFVFHKSISNTICDIVLYLQSESLNISLIYPGTILFWYSKTIFTIPHSTLPPAGSCFIF